MSSSGRFIVDLLAIHPFQDGNGRLARAVTTLLLLRAVYDYVLYTSLERIIEDNKREGYAALRESQIAMRDDPAAFGTWLFFFLWALAAQQHALEAKLRVERAVLQLSSTQQRIAELVIAHGRMTAPAIGAALELPARTVRDQLANLARRGLLAAHGEKRGRFYTPASAGDGVQPSLSPSGGTNPILAAIYERGGRISRDDLRTVVERHGYDPRVAGVLHGRRLAHLRRDPKTGDSVLTTRGEEVARQTLFTNRLVRGAKAERDIDIEE